jgi:hypothetical protein
MDKGASSHRARAERPYVGMRSLSSGRPKAGPVGFVHPTHRLIIWPRRGPTGGTAVVMKRSERAKPQRPCGSCTKPRKWMLTISEHARKTTVFREEQFSAVCGAAGGAGRTSGACIDRGNAIFCALILGMSGSRSTQQNRGDKGCHRPSHFGTLFLDLFWFSWKAGESAYLTQWHFVLLFCHGQGRPEPAADLRATLCRLLIRCGQL